MSTIAPSAREAPYAFGTTIGRGASTEEELALLERTREYLAAIGVALETLWVGVLAIPVGALHAGGEMKAHFAMFLEFEADRIRAQRNYDCFEPF